MLDLKSNHQKLDRAGHNEVTSLRVDRSVKPDSTGIWLSSDSGWCLYIWFTGSCLVESLAKTLSSHRWFRLTACTASMVGTRRSSNLPGYSKKMADPIGFCMYVMSLQSITNLKITAFNAFNESNLLNQMLYCSCARDASSNGPEAKQFGGLSSLNIPINAQIVLSSKHDLLQEMTSPEMASFKTVSTWPKMASLKTVSRWPILTSITTCAHSSPERLTASDTPKASQCTYEHRPFIHTISAALLCCWSNGWQLIEAFAFLATCSAPFPHCLLSTLKTILNCRKKP